MMSVHSAFAAVARKKASGFGTPVSARSVIFDIADNHGDASFLGVRSIEFRLDGSTISLPGSGYTADATSEANSSFQPEFAFDTSLAKDGSWTSRQWASSNGSNSNQRLIIVFDTAQDFNQIVINNSHSSGFDTDMGAQNVAIKYSPSVVTDTAYLGLIGDAVTLNDTAWPEHVASDAADNQTVWSA